MHKQVCVPRLNIHHSNCSTEGEKKIRNTLLTKQQLKDHNDKQSKERFFGAEASHFNQTTTTTKKKKGELTIKVWTETRYEGAIYRLKRVLMVTSEDMRAITKTQRTERLAPKLPFLMLQPPV